MFAVLVAVRGHDVEVGVGSVTAEQVVAVARDDAGVRLGADAREAIVRAREAIDVLAGDDLPHYGVSTGFGALATVHIPADRRAQLQRSLIRSHAAGTGAEVEREVVRSLMLLRLSTLATGRTGIRLETALALAGLLSHGVTPVVPEFGSLGCSGDLAPLAHCALALMGEGEVRDAAGVRRPAAEALAEVGMVPVELAEKEGLALINGTDGMLGMLLLALHDLRLLLRTADVAAAMSVEALLGTDRVFDADLQALRPHPGQATSAANVRALLDGSAIVASHRGPECTRVQDAYSLRCAPQVHGAARDTVGFAAAVAERELASAIDNPVVLADGRVESNGNFHGAPLAYALDFLAIPVADVASMSERRTDRFLDPARSQGLPPFLADDPGVDSGLMIAQYAAAGIVSELKRLAAPASADSIPSSAMQEDHVSMGWSAARKLRRGVDGLTRVLADRAAHGGTRARPAGSAATGRRHRCRPRHGPPAVDGPGPDRHLAPEIEAVAALVRDRLGRLRRRAGRRPPPLTVPAFAGFRRAPCESGHCPCESGDGWDDGSGAVGEGVSRHNEAMSSGARTVTAPRGTGLTARTWQTEAPLRMLMNNLDPEVAEHPEELVVYGGTGKAARDWPSFDALVRTLTDLRADETMLVQSGRPVGVMQTHEWAPRVLIANSNLVGEWATWEEFRRLEALGLTMYGQMTAGSWIYIGTQGILQGTYETFAAVAAKLAAKATTARRARRRLAGRHGDA